MKNLFFRVEIKLYLTVLNEISQYNIRPNDSLLIYFLIK
jgi:hypothetical protein